MAWKADFTAQESESLQQGVTGTGLLVSLSDRGFFDTFKEGGAFGKHNSSELVRELADIRGTGFGLPSSPDAVETETLAALQSAKTTLESKAPDELESYRQFVLDVAQSVADAAGGGETAEGGAIEKINSALRQGAPASPAATRPLLVLLACDQFLCPAARPTAPGQV